MLLGSNLPLEKELWQWLEDQKQQSQTEHHIWLMHYALFADSLNEPAWDITNLDHYLEWYFTIDHSSKDKMMDIFLATHTDRVITGHIHCRKDFSAQGIAFDWRRQLVFLIGMRDGRTETRHWDFINMMCILIKLKKHLFLWKNFQQPRDTAPAGTRCRNSVIIV